MNALTSEHTDSSASEAQGGALLRVSADKVGRLMDLVGELSLSVSETIRSSDLEGLELTEFEKSAHRLMMVVREVQDAAAELRLVPIGDVFRRMRRMVRELERTTEKEIDLVLEGGSRKQADAGESPSANMDGISTAAHRRADRKVRLTIQKASVCTQSPIGGRIRAACPERRRRPGVGRVAGSVRRIERRGDDGRQVDRNGESGRPH
jgi:hypothetical protein